MLFVLIAEILAAILGFWVAGELIARGTERLEPVVGQGMTGGVVLGLLGALPETIFVIIATLSGSYSIALGSALGGNIVLFTVGIGAIGVIYSFKWKKPIAMKEDYKVELLFLFASTAGLCLLLLYGPLDRVSGLALLLVYLMYIMYRYSNSHTRMMQHASTPEGKRIMLGASAYFIAGAILIVPLSYFFVGLISNFSVTLGVSALWIALVISPLAADLDEMISGYRIAVRNIGGGSTAIVSFIGSKIQNNTMLLGLIGLIAVQPVALGPAVPALIAIVVVNLVAIAIVIRGKLTNLESAFLVLLYFMAIIVALLG